MLDDVLISTNHNSIHYIIFMSGELSQPTKIKHNTLFAIILYLHAYLLSIWKHLIGALLTQCPFLLIQFHQPIEWGLHNWSNIINMLNLPSWLLFFRNIYLNFCGCAYYVLYKPWLWVLYNRYTTSWGGGFMNQLIWCTIGPKSFLFGTAQFSLWARLCN